MYADHFVTRKLQEFSPGQKYPCLQLLLLSMNSQNSPSLRQYSFKHPNKLCIIKKILD